MKDYLPDRPELTAELKRRLLAAGMAPCQPHSHDLSIENLNAARGVVSGLIFALLGWAMIAVFTVGGLLLIYGACG